MRSNKEDVCLGTVGASVGLPPRARSCRPVLGHWALSGRDTREGFLNTWPSSQHALGHPPRRHVWKQTKCDRPEGHGKGRV